MSGTDRITGNALEGWEHISQSINDILSTPIGSRIMRREYGSNIPNLIDNPLNDDTKINLFMATAEALYRWEPRFKLEKVMVTLANDKGKFMLELFGIDLSSQKPANMEVEL